jgi:hypothetical protein
MRALIYWFTGKLRCKIIMDGESPYLERYYLGTIFDTRFYIHRFVASDPDRGLHNHPWHWAISIILIGYYFEDTHYGLGQVKWINGLVGDSFHRVILPDGKKDVWTLFFHHAPKAKRWGFLRDKGQLGIVYSLHNPKGTEPEDWWTVAPKGRHHIKRLANG